MGETWGQGSTGWPAACSLDSPTNHLKLRQKVWVEDHMEFTKLGSRHGKIIKTCKNEGMEKLLSE